MLGRYNAGVRSMPGLPLVVFPHPLHSLNREQVLARADGVVDEVVRVLTERADRLAAEFKNRHLPGTAAARS